MPLIDLGPRGGRGRGRGRGERSAGIFSPAQGQAPSTLPQVGDFVSSTGRGAIWLWDNDLFQSNGSYVLQEIRLDLVINQGDFAWTVGTLEAIRAKAQQRGIAASDIPGNLANGAQLSRDWLALALWTVYAPNGNTDWRSMRLPAVLRLPNIGQLLNRTEGATLVTDNFNPNLVANNPFVSSGAGFDVQGQAYKPPSSYDGSSNNKANQTTMLAIAALAALVLLKG